MSNVSFSQATLPKGPPPMSMSQSATAPSTPLMPLSESPSVLTPNSMFTGTPVRRRYSRSVSQGNRTTGRIWTESCFILKGLEKSYELMCKSVCFIFVIDGIMTTNIDFLLILHVFIWHVFPDIVDNKEFYLSTEVRPPFTYASLIRQVSHRNVKMMRSDIFAWEQWSPKPKCGAEPHFFS